MHKIKPRKSAEKPVAISNLAGGKDETRKSQKPLVDVKEDQLIASMNMFKEYVEPENSKLRTALEEKTSNYYQWYHDSYIKQLPEMIDSLKSVPVDYNQGMLKRVSNISTLKYINLFDMTHSTIVVFKLYDHAQRKECNYATLFCEEVSRFPPRIKTSLPIESINGNILFRYTSTAASFISCDGEYKMRFIRYSDILLAKTKYPGIWDDLEEYLSQIKSRRTWTLHSHYFHAKDFSRDSDYMINTDVEQAVKNTLATNVLFLVSWFHTIYNEMLGITETHLNATFKEIMLSNKKIDIEFIRQLIKKYGSDDVEMFKVLTSHMVHTVFGNKTRYVPLGYKMIPLNIKEVQDPIRLKYKPWREFLISNKCNDLVINQIAPGFPIISDWFYIRNSKKGLFDNKSQYERLKNSELAKNVLNILYEAQRGTYFATSNLTGVNKSSEHIKQWISNKFRRLSEKINDPINYSIEELIMSDVTLSFSSEYVGRTMSDTINLIEKSKAYDEIIGKPFGDAGYDFLAKYTFEVCYNLAVINIKLGVIHGDFHLNNTTVGFLYSSEDPKYKVAYQLNKDLTFVFPNNGYFACIIDFSRGIINPEQYESLTDLSMPSTFKLITDYDKFTANEANNLLNLYLQLFPNKVKQKEELQVLFKNHYPAVFRLLTCIDIYMYSIRMIRMLNQVKFHVSKRSIDLFDKINKLSENFIATEMNHLLNEPNKNSDKILSEDYPMIQIIKKCFPEYIEGKVFKSIGTITDYYSLENDMKYSLAKYDLFPEVLKSTKYYAEKSERKDGAYKGDSKDREILDIPQITAKRKELREEYEKQKKESLEQVKYMAMKYTNVTD